MINGIEKPQNVNVYAQICIHHLDCSQSFAVTWDIRNKMTSLVLTQLFR